MPQTMVSLSKIFPQLQAELIEELEAKAVVHRFAAGETLVKKINTLRRL